MAAPTAWYALVPIALMAPAPAAATIYLSLAGAQQALFPGAEMIDRSIALNDAQRKAIAKAAGAPGYDRTQRIWEARAGGRRQGWFMLDRVIGKHDFITYALALSADGAVRGIEILDYRETYGGEVRNAAWRMQFAGKRDDDRVALGKDIRNISGATLSSRHVTDGVRRLLMTWQMLLAKS